jgi:choline kinase
MRKSLYEGSLWSGKPIKLSILVPTKDLVHSQFTYSLTQLIKTTSESGIDVYVFFDSSTILLNQREKLIEQAKEIKSDYVLWLDSDMVFPSTTALRLLNHKKDIVGCNYMKRCIPQKPVAYTNVKDWDSWVPMKPQEDLVKVEGVGMGCLLMKTNVFKKLKKPYFEFIYKEETKDWYGEDFNLLEKLRNNGYSVYIDTILSMDIKHLGTYAF